MAKNPHTGSSFDDFLKEEGITADIAIRLGIFFQQTPDFWLNLQKSYELDVM